MSTYRRSGRLTPYFQHTFVRDSSRNDDGGYRAVTLQARSSVLLAARAFSKGAIDSV